MRRRAAVLVAALLAGVPALGGCGDDGATADPELVDLLQERAGQPEDLARCIAEAVDGDDDVDRAELEAIIRGQGSTDVETADAYADAVESCARDEG